MVCVSVEGHIDVFDGTFGSLSRPRSIDAYEVIFFKSKGDPLYEGWLNFAQNAQRVIEEAGRANAVRV